jgi:hypothetical protein
VLDEDPAHGPRRCEEMPPPFPFRGRVAHQAQIGFVHQLGRLEGVILALVPHARSGESPQLGVDHWQKPPAGPIVAGRGGTERESEVAGIHRPIVLSVVRNIMVSSSERDLPGESHA